MEWNSNKCIHQTSLDCKRNADRAQRSLSGPLGTVPSFSLCGGKRKTHVFEQLHAALRLAHTSTPMTKQRTPLTRFSTCGKGQRPEVVEGEKAPMRWTLRPPLTVRYRLWSRLKVRERLDVGVKDESTTDFAAMGIIVFGC